MRFRSLDQKTRVGVIDSDRVFEVVPTSAEDGLVGLLALNDEVRRSVTEVALRGRGYVAQEVTLLAPIDMPGKVIGIGLNYESHRREMNVEPPTEPTVFSKFASSIAGPADAIVLPAVAAGRVDYEAELAVVLAGGGRNVPEAQAMSFVGGYMVANDVTARDWQVKKPMGQWLLGKTFDTFLPLGPAVVTADEVADPHALRISCTVSGEKMQDSTTAELIFGIPYLITYLSRVFALEAGDIILTGTPAGVGMARTPRRWLAPGDVVETTIEAIGTLTNPVRAEQPE